MFGKISGSGGDVQKKGWETFRREVKACPSRLIFEENVKLHRDAAKKKNVPIPEQIMREMDSSWTADVVDGLCLHCSG